ncbi:MAG: CaiB/BaiF CoA transferase family protein [Candidatus Baldrarchaeia archaeon]
MELLKGIRILDLTRLLPGDFCTLLLADMGAEVIKIEEPRAGDYIRWYPPLVAGYSAMHYYINRNKKSVTLNLRTEEGREIFYRLVKKADVVVESFRPGVVKSLRIDYETVKRYNPQVIYCSISGYGQTGPYRDFPGHDLNYIAIAGILGITGRRGGPPIIPGVQIADLSSGMFAAMAILAALIARERTGRGQYIDVSMLDCAISWLSIHAINYFIENVEPKRGEMLLNGGFPFYNVYETKDGKYITIACLEPKFWENFCKAVGRDDLRSKHFVTGDEREKVFEELRKIFKEKTRDEWFSILSKADVCCGPVYTFGEVFNDPHVKERGMVIEVEDKRTGKLKQLGFPVKFSDAKMSVRNVGPVLGEHTVEVLRELGYSDNQIRELKERGVI